MHTSLFWSCGYSSDKPQVLSVREVYSDKSSSFKATMGILLSGSVVDTMSVLSV